MDYENRFSLIYAPQVKEHLRSIEKKYYSLILGYSPKFQSILDRGRKQIHLTGGIEHEDFWQDLESS